MFVVFFSFRETLFEGLEGWSRQKGVSGMVIDKPRFDEDRAAGGSLFTF